MKLRMYTSLGVPAGEMEVPQEVLEAAQLLLKWSQENNLGEDWSLMGLGLVELTVRTVEAATMTRIQKMIGDQLAASRAQEQAPMPPQPQPAPTCGGPLYWEPYRNGAGVMYLTRCTVCGHTTSTYGHTPQMACQQPRR